jgi:hypothetical protein
MMRTRLVAYTVLGDRLGVIPDSLVTTVTCPFGSDLAALQIDYPAQGRRHGLLETKPEVAVEWWDEAADEWAEPDNARFHVIKRSWNSATDEESRKYDAVGVGWLTRKARVWTGKNMNASGQRQWNALSPGAIVGTVFDDAQGRGWGPGLSRTFTDSHDSAGEPWANELTIAFAPSDALDTVISSLVTQGVADVSWTGRALNLYNADATLGRDLTLGDAPVWVRHSGVTSAPEEGTIENLTTAVRIAVDNGGTFDRENPEALTTYGRLETFQTQSGVTDEATIALLSQQSLKEGEAEQVQLSREFNTDSTTFWPWRDYRPGDWVFVDREDGNARSRDRVRVQQVSLTRNEEGVSGHVTLGTRLDDYLTRLGRRTAAIVAGSTGEGGSGTPPIGADQRPPARVIGLVGSSDAYIDTAGIARARVVLVWSDVTVDNQGVLLGIRGYEVWGRRAGVDDWSLITTTVDLTWSPLETAQDWDFHVRAVSSTYVLGEFSSTVTLTTGHDVTPPPAPSAPVVTSRLRTVTVAWDGKTASGGGMPRDFDHVDVIRVNATPDGDAVVATLRVSLGTDSVVLAGGLPAIGEPITFRLRAYDRTGNGSDVGADVTVDIEGITGPDLEANSVTANSIDAGAIDGMLITGATFRTAAVGERVELTTGDGLVGYAPDGVTVMTQIDATTGRLSAIDAALRGSLTTVSTGNGSGTRLSEGSLKLYGDADISTVFAELRTDPGSGPSQYLRMFPPFTAPGNGLRNSFSLQGTAPGVPGNAWIYTDGAVSIDAVGQVYVRSQAGPLYINAAGAANILAGSTMYVSSGQTMSLVAGVSINLDAADDLSLLGRSTTTLRSLNGGTTVMTGSFFRVITGGVGNVAMQVSPDGSVQIPRHEIVTSGSQNVHMSSGGDIQRISSSARYKDRITPIEDFMPVDAILNAEAVVWLDKNEMAKHAGGGPAPRWSPGVIAEQLAEAGLEIYVTYDLPEHGGLPNGVAYERLIAAVIPLLRDHHHRITRLEGAAS